jgi:hypothetical protein
MVTAMGGGVKLGEEASLITEFNGLQDLADS